MKTYIDLIEARVNADPTYVSHYYINANDLTTDSLSYETMRTRAKAVAATLQAHHVSDHARVLLLLPPSFDYIISLFGCFYAKAIAVPAFPPVNDEMIKRIEIIMQNAGVQFVITNHEIAKKLKAIRLISPFSKGISALFPGNKWLHHDAIASLSMLAKANIICIEDITTEQSCDFQFNKISEDEVAYLQYTSGSTSSPKGVIVTHRNLMANLNQLQEMFLLTEESVIASWLPPYHDMGLVSNVFVPLYSKLKTINMSPFQFLRRPALWLEAVTKYHATIMGGPDFGFRLCLKKINAAQREKIDLSSLKVICSGAEKIQINTLTEFYNTFKSCGLNENVFFPSYGLAEATLFVSGKRGSLTEICHSFSEQELHTNHDEVTLQNATKTSIVSVGHTYGDTQLLILDTKSGLSLPDHHIGENMRCR